MEISTVYLYVSCVRVYVWGEQRTNATAVLAATAWPDARALTGIEMHTVGLNSYLRIHT